MSKLRPLPHDPDEVRMSFGDHLDELRRCLIRAILGLVLASILCFYFGDRIISVLTAPYYAAMKDRGFEPQMIQLDPTEAFLQYFTIALKFGFVVAAPWILYQIWRFVAVGLYPSERRMIRLFAPASIVLFITGASFMVLVVLTGLLGYLISVAAWFPVPGPNSSLMKFLQHAPIPVTTQPTTLPAAIPVLNDDPRAPRQGDAWFRRADNSLNVFVDGERFTLPLKAANREQFVQPFFSITDYLDFVTGMALAFGLGFQLPIVVIFIINAGIITSAQFRGARRYVILGIIVAAAFITPSPDIPSMLMLAVPMLILFESGLLIGRSLERRKTVDSPE